MKGSFGRKKLQLVAGATGAARVSAKGKSDLLTMPALGSIALPVRAQAPGAGGCWGATYSTAITNTAQFKAKSD